MFQVFWKNPTNGNEGVAEWPQTKGIADDYAATLAAHGYDVVVPAYEEAA